MIWTRDALAEGARDHGWRIGAHSYGVPEVRHWRNAGRLSIGRYCSIATGVQILLGGDHRREWVTTYPFSALRDEARHIQGHPTTRGSVRIGNDVWLAQSCVILSGVTVGDGAIVAANAVVTRDVAPYAMVGGNPAGLIRMRFSERQIAALLRIAWWDWPDARVDRFVEMLQSDDIDAFIDRVEREGSQTDS